MTSCLSFLFLVQHLIFVGCGASPRFTGLYLILMGSSRPATVKICTYMQCFGRGGLTASGELLLGGAVEALLSEAAGIMLDPLAVHLEVLTSSFTPHCDNVFTIFELHRMLTGRVGRVLTWRWAAGLWCRPPSPTTAVAAIPGARWR